MSKTVTLTCNQAMVLLDVYRGTFERERHLGTVNTDLAHLINNGLVTMGESVYCLLPAGKNLVEAMLSCGTKNCPEMPPITDIRKAVEKDIRQFMIDALTPDRGYAIPTANVGELIAKTLKIPQLSTDDLLEWTNTPPTQDGVYKWKQDLHSKPVGECWCRIIDGKLYSLDLTDGKRMVRDGDPVKFGGLWKGPHQTICWPLAK